MSGLVKRFPALSLFILALVLGVLPLTLVAAALLPAGFSQLGALSASAAGIILAAIEGRRGGYIDVFRGEMGNVYAYATLNVVVSLVILAIYGYRQLSRDRKNTIDQTT